MARIAVETLFMILALELAVRRINGLSFNRKAALSALDTRQIHCKLRAEYTSLLWAGKASSNLAHIKRCCRHCHHQS
jgi:hypothetical protein